MYCTYILYILQLTASGSPWGVYVYTYCIIYYKLPHWGHIPQSCSYSNSVQLAPLVLQILVVRRREGFTTLMATYTHMYTLCTYSLRFATVKDKQLRTPEQHTLIQTALEYVRMYNMWCATHNAMHSGCKFQLTVFDDFNLVSQPETKVSILGCFVVIQGLHIQLALSIRL